MACEQSAVSEWREVFHGSRTRAEIFRAILQAAGLDAQVLIDSFDAWGGMLVMGAETAGLFIPDHRVAEARALLARTQER